MVIDHDRTCLLSCHQEPTTYFHSNGSPSTEQCANPERRSHPQLNRANPRGESRVTFLDSTASCVTIPSAKLESYSYSQVSKQAKARTAAEEKGRKSNVAVTANGWPTPGRRPPQPAGCPKTGPARRSAACPSASFGACCSCPPTRWPRAQVRTPSGTAARVGALVRQEKRFGCVSQRRRGV